MSGGVDSSVSAILLQEQGYEVIGLTMKLWEEETEGSTSVSSSIEDAKKVCELLQIPHYVMDARECFQQKVVGNFIEMYANCQTPNPCVECNRYLKFGVFWEKAKELGCDYIATGHYAKTEFSEKYGRYVLKKSQADKKDQTYFLYAIQPEMLEKVIFPLADFTDKSQIRKIAEDKGLKIAEKPDSQEICFIPNGGYVDFLNRKGIKDGGQGDICLKDGTVLGKHSGLIHYTIGQRKGMGIAYPHPLYVIELDKKNNRVIVGEEKELYTDTLLAEEMNWLAIDKLEESIEIKAKVRYRAKEAEATIYPEKENKIKVVFKEPQRAITPGQSVVFYQGDVVIGGAKIRANPRVDIFVHSGDRLKK